MIDSDKNKAWGVQSHPHITVIGNENGKNKQILDCKSAN